MFPEAFCFLFIALTVGEITHAMAGTWYNKESFGCTAGLIIFIRHLNRDELIGGTMDKENRGTIGF